MAHYCDSAPGHPLHGPYHDTEYGFPAAEEAVLFERLVLEINQAGLSWLTVLQKRDNFRQACSRRLSSSPAARSRANFL
jgi:DNA-3-methyladenine glycosylase I